MISKTVLLLFAQAFFAQTITSQYFSGPWNEWLGLQAPLAYAGPLASSIAAPLAAPVAAPLATSLATCPLAMAELIGFPRGCSPSFRSEFAITSSSPVKVTGISLTSENVYDGPLSVAGRLPFLGAVALEGTVPSVGSGGVLYGCGGNIAIVNEGLAGPTRGPLEFPGLGYARVL